MNRLPLFLLTCTAVVTCSLADVLRVPSEWPTIELALAASADSDTVIASPGNYPVWIYAPTGQRTVASEYIETGDSLSVYSTVLSLSPSAAADSSSLIFVLSQSSLSLIGVTMLCDTGSLVPAWQITVGGGAVVVNGTFRVRRCILRNGTANLASAIWAHGGSILRLDSSAFLDHVGVQSTVTVDSADLIVRHCLFRRNTHLLGRSALDVRWSSLFMSHCVVDTNGLGSGTQPPIVIDSSPSPVVIDCTRFEANSLNPELLIGSALAILEAQTAVSNCQFIRNRGPSAPLIVSETGTTVTGCLFLENEATDRNPAGIFCQQGNYTISGCRFEGCRARSWSTFYGHGNITMDFCEFVANVAIGLDTGAAVAAFSQTEHYEFRNNLFIGNIPGAFTNRSADPEEVDFRDNYWGDASGPWHRTENPNGQGDAIFGQVQFDPWLTEPPLESAPRPKPPIPTSKDWIFAYPNPFNMQVKLSVNAVREPREIMIYDLNGREVDRLHIGSYQWQTTWRADGLATGVYFAVLGDASAKLLMLK